MPRTYDVHAHVIPERVMRDLERSEQHGVRLVVDDGPRLVIADRVTSGPLRPDLVDVEHRIERMDRARVDVQLLSPFIDATAYALPPDRGVLYARWFNEALAETVAARPARFLGLATVPLQAPAAAAAELRHAVTDLGMVGCEIATTVDGADLDTLDLDPFWGAAEELGCLVLLHPYQPLAGRGLSRYFLDNLVGRPAESTIAVAQVILAGVLERHPGLRLCVVHGGGFLPYQLGRLDRGWREKPGLVGPSLTRSPLEWAQALYYDTVVHSPEALAFLVGLVGDTQVVVGSDHPFEMGDPSPVDTVEAVPGMTADARERICGGNVQALLDAVSR